MSESPAHKRIWNDDAQLHEVETPNADVRLSEAALEVLRDQGVNAYEEYVKTHS